MEPNNGKPGTTDQSPRWEGPEENRPGGYLPAVDKPNENEDAAGETLNDPDRENAADVLERRNEEQAQSAPRDTEFAGHPDFSQDAAANKPPRGTGNSEPVDDADEETRHSNGVNKATTDQKHSSGHRTSGAGPALARHSKDA